MFLKQLVYAAAPTTAQTEFVPDLVSSDAAMALMQQHYGYGTWKVIFPGDVRLSPKVCEILGLPHMTEALPLESMVECYHPDDRGKLLGLIADALQGLHSFHCVLRILTPDGIEKAVETIGDLRLHDGRISEIFGLTRDVTHDMRRHAFSISRNMLLQDMITLMPMPIVVLDEHLFVLECSHYWLRCHGLIDRADAVGRRYYELFPRTPPEERKEYERALAGEIVKTKRIFINPSNVHKLERHTLIARWMASDDKVGGLLMMIGWSEFGIAAAASKAGGAAGFDGSLLDLLKEVS